MISLPPFDSEKLALSASFVESGLCALRLLWISKLLADHAVSLEDRCDLLISLIGTALRLL